MPRCRRTRTVFGLRGPPRGVDHATLPAVDEG